MRTLNPELSRLWLEALQAQLSVRVVRVYPSHRGGDGRQKSSRLKCDGRDKGAFGVVHVTQKSLMIEASGESPEHWSRRKLACASVSTFQGWLTSVTPLSAELGYSCIVSSNTMHVLSRFRPMPVSSLIYIRANFIETGLQLLASHFPSSV